MMRSLYSGISGLKNHQTRMDVIGNNIANVNTVGYKTSRVVFQDIFSQTVKAGSANAYNAGGLGGTNPIQIGLGVKLSTVDVIHTPAPVARTDYALDMMISGDGFFIVGYPRPGSGVEVDVLDANGDPVLDEDGNQVTRMEYEFDYYYTRAGNFKLDDYGYLTTSDGYYVMVYDVDIDDTVTPPLITPNTADGLKPLKIEDKQVGFAVDEKGIISILENNIRTPIGYIGIAMFSNPGGLEKAGNSLYRESAASGAMQEDVAERNGRGSVIGGGLEMSNVDLATEFTDMIVTQRGFQANSRIITVSDTMLEELVNLKR
ncbi:MAG: flagellar hook-basal body complex protein [Oscillospiraceae bacterium]|jgi:flagellar hook protein FlgE|nr:flagellar hook-basal body complex protein [Oscillospiraceae bacterium]